MPRLPEIPTNILPHHPDKAMPVPYQGLWPLNGQRGVVLIF